MDRKLKEILSGIQENERNAIREKEDDGLKQVQKFLNPVLDVKNDYENVRRTLLPGTASWILEDFLFKAWAGESQEEAGKVLWVSGSPGSGKTFISLVPYSPSHWNILLHCFNPKFTNKTDLSGCYTLVGSLRGR